TNSTTLVLQIDGSPGGWFQILVNPAGNPPALNVNGWKSLAAPSLSDLTVTLASGANDVWLGFKDAQGAIVLRKFHVVVDTTPPVVTVTDPVVTNPQGTTVRRPYIQLQGYANERLSSLTYTLVNSAGTLADQPAYVLRSDFDT